MSGVFSDANDLRVAESVYRLAVAPKEGFCFFADPRHALEITPDWLGLSVECPEGIDWLERGATFTLSLDIHGLHSLWVKRIAAYEPTSYLSLVQVDGPFTQWAHEWRFEADGDGCLVRESVEYAHLGGSLFQRLTVQPELEKLFVYRHRRVIERFNGTLKSTLGHGRISSSIIHSD